MSEHLYFPALVVDFDNTIRHPPEGETFIDGPEDVHLYDGIGARLWDWRDSGWILLGLTNQGGVAHGHKTPDDFHREVGVMRNQFERQGYRWPFHDYHAEFQKANGTEERYAARSLCRKPAYGALAVMERSLYREHGLRPDWDRSIMVGDREDDFGCAKGAGLRFCHATAFRNRPRETIENDAPHVQNIGWEDIRGGRFGPPDEDEE